MTNLQAILNYQDVDRELYAIERELSASEERKEYVMSSLDTGSFMHEVIEKFSKFIVAKNIAWQDLVLDEKKKALAL